MVLLMFGVVLTVVTVLIILSVHVLWVVVVLTFSMRRLCCGIVWGVTVVVVGVRGVLLLVLLLMLALVLSVVLPMVVLLCGVVLVVW